jgi:hypothetical protein
MSKKDSLAIPRYAQIAPGELDPTEKWEFSDETRIFREIDCYKKWEHELIP